MLTFLDDNDLTETEKADINQILYHKSNDDKCFFLDEPESRDALLRYIKTHGQPQVENYQAYQSDVTKFNPEHLAHNMAAYIASQQPPTTGAGTQVPFNPPCAYYFPHPFPTHQQPTTHGGQLMHQPSAAAMLSPPPGSPQWPPFYRMIHQQVGTHHHNMPIFCPIFCQTAATTAATSSAAEMHAAAAFHAAMAASNDGPRGGNASSQTTSAVQGSYGNEIPKVRSEHAASALPAPHDAHAARSNVAASLNNSAEAIIQHVPVSTDQLTHRHNSNSGGSNTDVVPIDPEPNEHLPLNNSLLAQEIAISREDGVSGVANNNANLRATSTPIDSDANLIIQKSEEFDISPLLTETTTVKPEEISSPEKPEDDIESNPKITVSPQIEVTVDQAQQGIGDVEMPKSQNEQPAQTPRFLKNQDTVMQTVTATTAASAPPAPKTWASLFRNSPTAANAIVISKLVEDDRHQLATAVAASLNDANANNQPAQLATATQTVYSSAATCAHQTFVGDKSSPFTVAITTVERDPPARKLRQALSSCKLAHKGPQFLPKGLKNVGNWCYVNSVLQALLACPPFVHLLRNLSFLEMRSPSSTPMLDALVKFVGEFFVDRYTRKPGDEKNDPFEPSYVYNVLSSLRSDLGYRGRQEDAEEFLSFVLNHLHEEMAACLNTNSSADPSSLQQKEDVRHNTSDVSNSSNNDSSEWQQVMPGRKLATARMSKLAPTPIAEIFSGVVRNVFVQTGQKDSINSESFFTLQLSVQFNENTSSTTPLTLAHALAQMGREIILRRDPMKKNDIEISRRTTFQELPLVLILHLKYFTYADDSVKKHMKQIVYNMDLQIDKNLAPTLNNNKFARSYKLFAVVFHHGENAEGGHYTADIFHGGQWLSMDDGKCDQVTEAHVLDYLPPRVPYLLFYRRCDVFCDNRGSYPANNNNVMSGGGQQQAYINFSKNRFSAPSSDNN